MVCFPTPLKLCTTTSPDQTLCNKASNLESYSRAGFLLISLNIPFDLGKGRIDSPPSFTMTANDEGRSEFSFPAKASPGYLEAFSGQ